MSPDSGLPTSLVGVIGLGLIGTALAERMASAGVALLGFDLKASAQQGLPEAGLSLAADAQSVLSACATTLIAVFDAPQVLEILQGLPQAAESGEAPKRRVLLCTTIEPAALQAVETACARKGVELVEFPISGTSQQVRQGEGLGLIVGSAQAYSALQALFAVLTPRHQYLGSRYGDATKTKLAINLAVLLNRAALAESLALAMRLGLDPAEHLAVLKASAAYSQVMDTKGEKMIQGDFSSQSRIAGTLKDADIIAELAAQAGLWLPLTEANRRLLQHTKAQLGPDVDPSAIIQALQNPPGRIPH